MHAIVGIIVLGILIPVFIWWVYNLMVMVGRNYVHSGRRRLEDFSRLGLRESYDISVYGMLIMPGEFVKRWGFKIYFNHHYWPEKWGRYKARMNKIWRGKWFP